MTKEEIQKIRKEILNSCKPILEKAINELKSQTFYDAAVQADKYNNKELAGRFREAGDAALDREQHTEFEESLDIYKEFEIDGTNFILAHYIPAGINVLICLKDKSLLYVVRVAEDEISEINSIEFKADIASLFKRKPLQKPNVPAIGAVLMSGEKGVDWKINTPQNRHQLSESRKRAIELVEIINDELGTELSWRWFFADRQQKKGVGTSESKYHALIGATAEGYHIGIAKRKNTSTTYSIYYALIGNREKSFVLTIYKTMTDTFLWGNQLPGTIYSAIMKTQAKWEGDLAKPTPTTSNIQNIWEFFRDNRRIGRMALNFINQQIDRKITMDMIEDAAARDANGDGPGCGKWSSLNNTELDPDAMEVSKPKKEEVPTDDMSDFMDV